MTTNDELRKLAEAASSEEGYLVSFQRNYLWMGMKDNRFQFIQAASPQKILELLDRIAELEIDANRYQWLKRNHLQTSPDSWIRTGDDLEDAIDGEIREDKKQ